MTHSEGNLSKLYLATDLLTSALEASENPMGKYDGLKLVEPGSWVIVSEMPDVKTYQVKTEEMALSSEVLGQLALRPEGMQFEFRPPFFLRDTDHPQFSRATITVHTVLRESEGGGPVDDMLTIIKRGTESYRLDRVWNRDPYHKFMDEKDISYVLTTDYIQTHRAEVLLDAMALLTKQYVLKDEFGD